MTETPVIDAHVHILGEGHWPEEWFDWVALDWASKRSGRRPEDIRGKIEAGLVDPRGDRLVADMDAAKVRISVNLPMDWGPDFTSRTSIYEVNEQGFAVAERHQGRIISFVGIDPRRDGAAAYVEQCFADGRAKGLKLYPPCGFDVYSPEVQPLYELCVRYRKPVLFHTGETLQRLQARRAQPIALQDVTARHPELIVLIGHAGARLWWDEALSVAAHSINGYLETSVWIWEGTSDDDQSAFIRKLDQARNRIGIEKIVFGSDHLAGPRIRGAGFLDHVVGWYRNLPAKAVEIGIKFTDEDVEKILFANAARVFGLASGVKSDGV